MDLYDAEIATNDAAFGELLDLLARRKLLEDTVIVFVSDHGEEFLDHGGWEHGKTLHDEMLDVPLIVRVPGLARGRTVEQQVQQADVAPTILDLLGLPPTPGQEGRSRLREMMGQEPPSADPAESATFSWLEESGLRAAAVTTPRWRLIEKRFPIPGRYLYDRQADPDEHHDLSRERPVRTGFLREQLRIAERPRKGMLRAGEAAVGPEVARQLKALGYLH
ncbi:MAG TPA: sulfatase-like hydrolase/transferase [Thermoanaerobaculia bacterium]|nr:sulfatase-like hydrolase/transferase [Thermoanaerobaculia bacterium]